MLLTSLDAPGVSSNSATLAWPGARAMFENAFELNLERRIKYLWRLALTWNVRGRLLRELDGQALAKALFRAQPRAFYPLMNHLIDRRMSARRPPAHDAGEPARRVRRRWATRPTCAAC